MTRIDCILYSECVLVLCRKIVNNCYLFSVELCLMDYFYNIAIDATA